MCVAFVSNVVYPWVTGGAEKRIHEIATRLTDKGNDVTIYGRHFWDGPEQTTHEGMTLRAVSPERELYTDDDGRRSITEALEFSKDVIRPLRRNIDDHNVVVASVFPYFSVLAAKLATLGTDTPLITTWHEVWGDTGVTTSATSPPRKDRRTRHCTHATALHHRLGHHRRQTRRHRSQPKQHSNHPQRDRLRPDP